jgi:ribosomal protein L10
MGNKTKVENIAKKKALILRTFELFSKYNMICLCSLEHVGSNQVQQIRRILDNKKSILVVTKNVAC